MHRAPASIFVFAIVSCLVVCAPTSTAQPRLEFSCATFPATATESMLRERFGADHVRTGPVEGGGAEGEFTEGTVMFGESSDAKVEILWKNRPSKSVPFLVWITGQRSRWRSPDGISLGTDLKAVERANRRPFRMFGFGFDGSGTVASWNEGRLAASTSAACRMRLSLGTGSIENYEAARLRAYEQVAGDKVFSSGHPAIQKLNPRVYKMFLDYERQPDR
jgi:hypothetical protein